MLDLITLQTLKNDELPENLEKYQKVIEKDPIAAKALANRSGYQGFDKFELGLELKNLSYDDLLKRIKGPGASSFYAQMMLMLVRRVRKASQENEYLQDFDLSLDSDLNEDYLQNETPREVANEILIRFVGEDGLLLAVRKSQRLGEYLRDAAKEKHLPEEMLSKLKLNLEWLGEHYEDASRQLGIDYKPLFHAQSDAVL